MHHFWGNAIHFICSRRWNRCSQPTERCLSISSAAACKANQRESTRSQEWAWFCRDHRDLFGKCRPSSMVGGNQTETDGGIAFLDWSVRCARSHGGSMRRERVSAQECWFNFCILTSCINKKIYINPVGNCNSRKMFLYQSITLLMLSRQFEIENLQPLTNSVLEHCQYSKFLHPNLRIISTLAVLIEHV